MPVLAQRRGEALLASLRSFGEATGRELVVEATQNKCVSLAEEMCSQDGKLVSHLIWIHWDDVSASFNRIVVLDKHVRLIYAPPTQRRSINPAKIRKPHGASQGRLACDVGRPCLSHV